MPSAETDSGSSDPAHWLRRWHEHADREALGQLLAVEVGAIKEALSRRWDPRTPPDFAISDVAQEAVLRVLAVDGHPKFESPAAVRAYLWTAALRRLQDRLRERFAHPATEPDDRALAGELAASGGLGEVERRDRADALKFALGLLEPDEQRLLQLLFDQSLSLEDAATEMGIRLHTARDLRAAAMERLQRTLRHWTQIIG